MRETGQLAKHFSISEFPRPSLEREFAIQKERGKLRPMFFGTA